MKPIPSFLSATLARYDLQRLSGDLFDLQRQTASGYKAADLKGYGNESGRIISARTAIAQSSARVDAANRLLTRFDIQETAFNKLSSAAKDLKQNIFTALSTNDGSFLASQLQSAFEMSTDALNQSYEGAPLFAGERRDVQPVNARTLDEAAANLSVGTLFNEGVRDQTADVGIGATITVAPRASTIGAGLYGVFSDLNAITRNNGLGTPLTTTQRDQLTQIAGRLDTALTAVLTAQGRSGNAQAQLEKGIERLETRSNLLSKHLGSMADANLAEVSMRLSAVQTQYEATARVFSQIKDLSLVNFLR